MVRGMWKFPSSYSIPVDYPFCGFKDSKFFSFGYSAFGNFADQQYFSVELRIRKKRWNSNKSVYRINRPAKMFGKGWGMSPHCDCGLTTITRGHNNVYCRQSISDTERPLLLDCFLLFLRRKNLWMNSWGIFFIICYLLEVDFGAWFYVSNESFSFSESWLTPIKRWHVGVHFLTPLLLTHLKGLTPPSR